MKKAEEWWHEFTKDLKGINQVVYNVQKQILLDRIREIQLDMLEYAVNKCAENAEAVGMANGEGIVIKASVLKTIDEIKNEIL